MTTPMHPSSLDEVIRMVVRVDVAPDLLAWAVERAGWDEETAERRAPQLEDWMDGTRRPTLKQMESFAKATHAPFGQLFLPVPPVEELPIPDMRTIGDTETPRPSADLLDTIYLCQERQDWYRGHARENGIDGPEFVGTAEPATSPSLIAQRIRAMLDFEPEARAAFTTWTDALRRLIDRIEDVGVLVMVSGVVGNNTHRRLDPKEFRGLALADRTAPLIFVNGADTKAAQIFTLIHELAHIWLGGSALSDAAMAVRATVEEERWCNEVAAEVLVPIASIRRDHEEGVGTDELERLAKKYRVSTLVVLKRIHDAGRLPWGDFRERYEEELARLLRIMDLKSDAASGGDFYRTQPLRLSRQFAQAVIASTREGATAYREAYQLLGTQKHSTFEKLAGELGVP